MMVCIGLTMRLGRYFAKKFGVILTLYISNVLCALSIFVASFMLTFGGKSAFIKGLLCFMEYCLDYLLASPS